MLGRILSDDGTLPLTVSVHDQNGTCYLEIPVTLGPYDNPLPTGPVTEKQALQAMGARASAEKGLPSLSDCVAAIETAARKAREDSTAEDNHT